MDNISTSPIIPSAGYIKKSEDPKKEKNHHKKALIVCLSIAAFLTISAIIFIIINVQKSTQHHPETDNLTASNEQGEQKNKDDTKNEDDETIRWSKRPDSALLTGNSLQTQVFKKALFIISAGNIYGTLKLSNFYEKPYLEVNTLTNKPQVVTPYKYLSTLSQDAKIASIIPSHVQYASNIEGRTIKKLNSQSCNFLYAVSDCSKYQLGSLPGTQGIINRKTATEVQNAFKSYYGKTSIVPQKANACPRVMLDQNTKQYVYDDSCLTNKKHDITFIYIYATVINDDEAYVDFAGGLMETPTKQKPNNLTVYRDLDLKKVYKTIANPNNFLINYENYNNFDHYRLIFAKEGNNYVYQSFKQLQ